MYIRINTLATRILFDGNTAIGMEYESSSIIKQVFSRKEVILSAGAYNTPQLLQLSGIGDKNLLKEHAIPVIIDNPNIGSNMQDHPIFGITMKAKEGIDTFDRFNRYPQKLFSTLEWMNSKSNSLVSNCGEVNGLLDQSTQRKMVKKLLIFRLLLLQLCLLIMV